MENYRVAATQAHTGVSFFVGDTFKTEQEAHDEADLLMSDPLYEYCYLSAVYDNPDLKDDDRVERIFEQLPEEAVQFIFEEAA